MAKQLAELRKVVEKTPKDTRSLLRLAELEAKTGHSSEACEMYSRAGDLFVVQGFARRAISAFSQGLDVARESALVDRVAPLARALWKLYVNEKLPREALAMIDTSSKWLIERGFDAAALPLLEARVELDDCDVARVRLAETLFRLGEATKASSELVTVFMRLHAQKRRDEAIDVAERLLGDRRDKEIARMAAELHLARNRPGDAFLAIAKLRICCEESPTHVPTLQLLARAFELAGHPDKAMRVLTEIEALTGRGKSKAEKAAAKAARSEASKLAKLVKAAAQTPPQAQAKPAAQAPAQAKADPEAKAAPAKAAPQAKAAPEAKAAPAKAAPQAKAAPAPQAKAAPPRPSAKAKPKRREESVSISVDIDEAWNELLVEAKRNEPSSSGERVFDPSRQSFWAVEESPTTTENSVMSVSIDELEIVGSGGTPESGPQPVSMLETALEGIESLMAQGRYDEAIVMVGRYLVMRPNNSLLLDKKAEIEDLQNSHNEGPPPALFGFDPRRDSERSIPTRTASVKAS